MRFDPTLTPFLSSEIFLVSLPLLDGFKLNHTMFVDKKKVSGGFVPLAKTDFVFSVKNMSVQKIIPHDSR